MSNSVQKKGSIQKKGNVYYAVIALNGKRKWTRGGTKKDAQRILNEQLNELDNGTYKEIPKMKFSDFSDLWLKSYAEAKVKPSTLVGYKDTIKRLLTPSFGQTCLTEITTAKLQSYATNRLKSVSGKTVCNEIVVMKEMFKHAYRWGYLKHNPAEYVERPRIKKSEIGILSPNEIETLLNNSNERYRVAFLTGFMTGMRAGELWGLQWKDIDWNSNQIHVRRSLWKGQFQTPKSKCSIRKIKNTINYISVNLC